MNFFYFLHIFYILTYFIKLSHLQIPVFIES